MSEPKGGAEHPIGPGPPLLAAREAGSQAETGTVRLFPLAAFV